MQELNFRTVRECLDGLDFQPDAEAGLAALNAIAQKYLRMKAALELVLACDVSGGGVSAAKRAADEALSQ